MHYLRLLTISGFLVVALAFFVSCIDSNQDNLTDPTVDPNLPTPQNLSVQLLDMNCVKISWTYAEEEVEILSFELFRSSNQAGETLLATMAFNDSVLSYVDCSVPVEQRSIQAYSYEVRAIAVNNVRSNLVTSFPVIVGLIAHWDFNEDGGTTLEDISGNGNHGEIIGATWSDGVVDGALAFDGESNVTVQDADLLDITGGITLSAWVNFGNSLEHYETVLGKRDATVRKESNYALRTGMGSGVDELEFYWSYPGGWNIFTSTNANFEPNTWYHLAAVYDGTQVKLYKDGVPLTGYCREGGCATPLLAEDNLLRLGQPGEYPDQADEAPESLSGILDNVRIYNYALGPADILEIKESEE